MKPRSVLILLAIGLATTAVLIACTGYRHEACRLNEKSKVPEELFDLYFVEADDEGWFWQPQQADLALKAIEQSAQERDTFVLLYLHGWLAPFVALLRQKVQSFRKTCATAERVVPQPPC